MNKAELTALVGQKVGYAETYDWDRGNLVTIATLVAGPDSPEFADRPRWTPSGATWLIRTPDKVHGGTVQQWVPPGRIRCTEAEAIERNAAVEARRLAEVAADNRRRMAIDAMKEAGFASAAYASMERISISVEDAERIASALGVQFVGNR